ncbi:acetamidase/formamidase family protein [archaeon]|nr:acetamidase/formamidase family protein [archaeon]
MKKINCNKSIALEKIEPLDKVELGETFLVETINAYGERFETMADLLKLITGKNSAHHHPLTGPIYVNNVKEGDVLKVEIQKIVPYEMAQALSKTAGTDPLDDPLFGDRAPIIAKAIKGRREILGIEYTEGIILSYQPMIGIIGTSPKEGKIKTGHAGITGGNLDIPFVTENVIVYLPCQVDGGLLYLGDTHALQSYGELGGVALECSADIQLKITKCIANQGWFDNDPYLERQNSLPIVIVGKEPLTQKKGVGIVGISSDFNHLDQSVQNAYRNAIKFIKQICPRVSWGGARNLVTLIGHSLNGQAASKTAEATSMIFFKEEDLEQVYRCSTNTLEEVMETVYRREK